MSVGALEGEESGVAAHENSLQGWADELLGVVDALTEVMPYS